jgi:hypothetical protein
VLLLLIIINVADDMVDIQRAGAATASTGLLPLKAAP